MAVPTILRFYYCGKGDTILIETARAGTSASEWALVDCHLTKSSGSYDRVRALIAKRSIKKLKFLCLTHPDRDHYYGMLSLLKEHFYDKGSDSLQIDQFWDAGVHFSRLAAIAQRMGTEEIRKELEQLYRFLARSSLADKIDHCPMPQGMLSDIDFGEFDILSLSPKPNRVDRFNQQTFDTICRAPFRDVRYHKEQSNNLSVLLALMHKTLPINIVLGGDATAEAWSEALDVWPHFLKRLARKESAFAVVKVSHHGAYGSLYPRLYEHFCTPRETIAVLSVGPGDPNHPHPDVLKVLDHYGIRHYCTSAPSTGNRCSYPKGPLFGERLPTGSGGASSKPQNTFADIEVRIRKRGRPRVFRRKCLIP